MTNEQPSSETLLYVTYLVDHDQGLLAVADTLGSPEGDWEQITREEFDRLHRLGYELEGDLE